LVGRRQMALVPSAGTLLATALNTVSVASYTMHGASASFNYARGKWEPIVFG
jgi:hypothetical protein